jgi:hypothetical protein
MKRRIEIAARGSSHKRNDREFVSIFHPCNVSGDENGPREMGDVWMTEFCPVDV